MEKSAPDRSMQPGENPEQAWSRLREAISDKHPSLGPILAKGVVKSSDGSRMVIDIEGNALTDSRIRKNKNVIQAIGRRLLGKDAAVVLNVIRKTPDERNQKKDKDTQAKQDALNHPLVADALEIFDGKVVDVKIL